MKRALAILVASLCLGIFIVSSNSDWMKAIAQSRYAPSSSFPAYKYRYGDLYGFSYLPYYKENSFKLVDVKPYYLQKHDSNSVQLYSICDSYLSNYLVNDSLLHYADSYKYSRWGYEGKQVYLNPKKANVLLIEMVERNFRQYLQDTAYLYKHLGVVNSPNKESEQEFSHTSWLGSHVFNKGIDDNLEFNLFDYGLFVPIKEFKAQLNYAIFNRTSPDVVVSKTRRQLYYNLTIDTANYYSSFNKLSNKELTTIITNLNAANQHYRRLGFKQVYLAIMPNPVTILEPTMGAYNGLIPRVQNSPDLLMPVIDVYSKLQHNKARHIYQASDTHWAKAGFFLGLAEIDSTLAVSARQQIR